MSALGRITAAGSLAALGLFTAVPAAVAATSSSPAANTVKCPNPAGNYPPGQCKKIESSASTFTPGAPGTFSAGGFNSGEAVQVWLFSTPILLATVQADASGLATATVTIPATIPPGAHHIEMRGVTSGVSLSLPITVAGSTRSTHNASAAASLPFTGANEAIPLAAAGGAMVVAGGLTLLSVRRRRRPVTA